MIIYAMLAVCALVMTLTVYRYDMYDREPWYMVILTLGLGAALMWLVGHAEDAVIEALRTAPDEVVLPAAVAAICEELTKVLIVALIALFFRHQFNDPMDGVIYGAFAGLGMAIEESMHYISYSALSAELVAQELVRLVMHMLLGAIGGYALGMARIHRPRWSWLLVACILTTAGLHFLWNLLAASLSRSIATRYRLLGVGILLVASILFVLLVGSAHFWSGREFAGTSRRSIWRWPLTLFFAGGPDEPRTASDSASKNDG